MSYAGGPVLTDQHNAYTWNNVPAYHDGKVIVYRVNETSPLLDDDTYSVKYSHTSDKFEKVFTLIDDGNTSELATRNQTVDVTNKHETRVINIDAYKTWNDEDQTKRKQATLTLWKTVNGARSVVTTVVNGQTVWDEGTVTEEDKTDPVKTWSDLPVYEMGYPITYTIEETTIDGYKTTYEVDYTKPGATETDPDVVVDEPGSSIDASEVKRTYYAAGDTIPQGKKVGDENTTAIFRIENEETIDIEVKKTWLDGANANVTFELWRTTMEEADLTDSSFTEKVICYQNNDTLERISVQDYNNLPSEQKSNYSEVKGKNWSPYDPNDASVTVDGWKKADEHEFAASIFDNTQDTDVKTYTFNDLPRQEVSMY